MFFKLFKKKKIYRIKVIWQNTIAIQHNSDTFIVAKDEYDVVEKIHKIYGYYDYKIDSIEEISNDQFNRWGSK